MEHVNLCRGKLARADFLLKQDVQLCEGAAAWLGEAEICVYDAKEANGRLKQVSSCHVQRDVVTYPEETGVVSPVPCRLVEHVWSEDAGDNADDVAALVSSVRYADR